MTYIPYNEAIGYVYFSNKKKPLQQCILSGVSCAVIRSANLLAI